MTKEVFRIQIPFVRLSEVEARVPYPTIQENWNLDFKKLEFIFNSGARAVVFKRRKGIKEEINSKKVPSEI